MAGLCCFRMLGRLQELSQLVQMGNFSLPYMTESMRFPLYVDICIP